MKCGMTTYICGGMRTKTCEEGQCLTNMNNVLEKSFQIEVRI